MGSTRRKFTPEHKAGAVDLVTSSGRPVAEIARDLGIDEGTLGNWVNMAKKSGEIKDKPLGIDERARLKELESEVRRLKMEREILKKSGGVVRESEPVKFSFIRGMNEGERREPRRDRISLSLMCEALEVSRAGFSAWHSRARSERAADDAELTGIIKQIHEERERRLGIDRLVVELAKRGRRHSPTRVRGLARAAGLT